MTLQEANLLKRLKKAQICQDRQVYIDFDALTLKTVGDVTQKCKEVKIARYRGAIHSTLKSLSDANYIDIKGNNIHVNHQGWNAFQLTVQDAVRFTFRDIVVPLLVSGAAVWGPAIVRFVKSLIG